MRLNLKNIFFMAAAVLTAPVSIAHEAEAQNYTGTTDIRGCKTPPVPVNVPEYRPGDRVRVFPGGAYCLDLEQRDQAASSQYSYAPPPPPRARAPSYTPAAPLPPPAYAQQPYSNPQTYDNGQGQQQEYDDRGAEYEAPSSDGSYINLSTIGCGAIINRFKNNPYNVVQHDPNGVCTILRPLRGEYDDGHRDDRYDRPRRDEDRQHQDRRDQRQAPGWDGH